MAGANITVSGMPREMGGLKESQTAFRKHHIEVGDALLNVSGIGTIDGKPKDKDEPRPPYKKQDLPKMLYHPEKGEHICYSKAEVEEKLKTGWRKEPYRKPQVALEDPRAEKFALQKQLKEKDGQITALGDQLQRALDRLDRLESKAAEAPVK